MTDSIKPWVEVVSLHPDVITEHFDESIFAVDLEGIAQKLPRVPAVYRDAEQFFRASYITTGLRSLLVDVLSRLSGGEGNRVLKMITPFGGGKSHTMAALLHAVTKPNSLSVIPEGKGLPRPEKAHWAVFDGQYFDATNGRTVAEHDLRIRTLWGWIGWSLWGLKGYEVVRDQDQARVAPGGDLIAKLLDEGPNLILIDEFLQYLISAGGVKVQDTTLRAETLNFLHRLTVAVDNSQNSVLVFSLPSSDPREALDYSNLHQMVSHLAARVDQHREPVEGNEILAVIQRRLLARIPDDLDSSPAANAYQELVTQMKRAYAHGDAERRQAEEEGIRLRDQLRAAYPFHPSLIGLMRERWAAIPEFQRTRGALRFLATCLRACNKEGKSRAVLGPCDVPMHDPTVRLAFFKEVGQQSEFQAVLEHDLVGVNARARKIDDRRAKENPSEANKKPATRIATAILMYSFGGLRRTGGQEGDLLPPGINEQELLSVCVGPDLDTTTAQACLKELKEQCLYLHFDGVRYCFKKDPNVTLLIEQEADNVAKSEDRIRAKIKEMLEERLAGHRTAIIWPERPADIPDKDSSFLVAYLPLEFTNQSKTKRETTAKELLEKKGDAPRSYRNGLGLAIPTSDQIEILQRSVRYLLAIEQVKAKSKLHNLTDENRSQLRERESTEKASAESALLKLYVEVWLPRVENGGLGIEVIAVGGRPLQTTLNDKREAAVHQRVMELLTVFQPRVFGSLKPAKIIELFNLGEGTPPRVGCKVSDLIEGFYAFIGFPRLLSGEVVCRAIALGVKEGYFGYVSGGVPVLGDDGKFQVALAKVRFNTPVAPDEIDVDSGFILMPQAIPAPPPAPPVQTTAPDPDGTNQPPVTPETDPGVPPSPPPPPPTGVPIQRRFDFTFSATRDQLYTVWNAAANLADLAGKVTITIHAESAEGFDQSKLQNGVIEPLSEAGLIAEE